uniref:Uncharacterized protein n=1 Tax=Onchocerca volvulus TaxID=6282 RepID=A0A8R1XVB0_ONCVO
MMRTINIRCNWNNLNERSEDYNVYFNLSTIPVTLTYCAYNQRTKAIKSQIREQLCESLQKCANRSLWKTLSFVITHYSNSLHFSVQATLPPSPKFGKEQKLSVIRESEKQQQIREQREIANTSKEQQKSKRDTATQIDLEAGANSQKLSGFTTVFFGPHPLITDGTLSVKCVQVGDGNIQQLK